jgi:septal ring factor EnvC (AmiA/AmiB activator)
MRRVCIGMILALAIMPAAARGQEDLKPDQLQKLYKDTLAQLKAAQDRKAELSARVDDLEKQLQEANAQNDQLKRQTADFADRTYFLRTYYAAWLQFIATRPSLKVDWDIYLNTLAPLGASGPIPFTDPEWPLSAKH